MRDEAEPGGFQDQTRDLIKKAVDIFPFRDRPYLDEFFVDFKDEENNLSGEACLIFHADTIVFKLVAGLLRNNKEGANPRTLIWLHVHSPAGPDSAGAHFKRANYDNLTDINKLGPSALQPTWDYFKLLEEGISTGSLHLSQRMKICADTSKVAS